MHEEKNRMKEKMVKKPIILIFCLCLILTGCEGIEQEKRHREMTSYIQTTTQSQPTSQVQMDKQTGPTHNTTEEMPDDRIIKEINRCYVEPDLKEVMTEDDMKNYKKLTDGIVERKESVELFGDVNAELILRAFKKGPYYFLVTEIVEDGEDEEAPYIKIIYKYSKQEQKEFLEYIEGEYLDILNQIIKEEYNELERALAVYNYFGERVDYDYKRLEKLIKPEDFDVDFGMEIYNGLKTNKGICYSFSYLNIFALFQLGIESFALDGTSIKNPGNPHKWVMIKIDGKFYHTDPTWDGERGGKTLKYFGMTDEDRYATGIMQRDFGDYHESDYGNIICDDGLLQVFKTVKSWKFIEDHKMELSFSEEDVFIFDTVSKKILPDTSSE